MSVWCVIWSMLVTKVPSVVKRIVGWLMQVDLVSKFCVKIMSVIMMGVIMLIVRGLCVLSPLKDLDWWSGVKVLFCYEECCYCWVLLCYLSLIWVSWHTLKALTDSSCVKVYAIMLSVVMLGVIMLFVTLLRVKTPLEDLA